MSGSSVDCSDLVRFASVVIRLATKKGVLHELKRGSELEKGYYALFGNLLYGFEHESDVNSVKALIFLESSNCKVTNLNATPILSISTVGGRTINFTAKEVSELYEWLNEIESNKLVNINRKIEDSETSMVALKHKVEILENAHAESEKVYMSMKTESVKAKSVVKTLQLQLDESEKQKNELSNLLKTSESERILLLKSRGIMPKRMPYWTIQDNYAEDILKCMKIWTGTWNVMGKEPFAHMDRERSKRLLRTFIPAGYDIYIVGLQECASENIFECIDALLQSEGYKRLQWTLNNTNIGSYFNSHNALDSPDPSKLYSKNKDIYYISTVVYVKNKIAADVSILNVVNESLSDSGTEGAVAMALNVFGRIIAIINSQFDEKLNETRRDQYQTLFTELGGKLGELGYHVNEQFHHIIWLGDMNHKLVDTSGNILPVESAVKMLEDGRLMRNLFDAHDELNRDKKQHLVFFNYREANPYPNFYPTYRKIPNHGPVDYTSVQWVQNVYMLQKKVSFFKGGKVKEYTPGFSDRIFYYSMVDLAEDLIPESLPVDFEIQAKSTDSEDEEVANTSVSIDHYKCINDGEGLTASEHSPVLCTFLLRIRHDYDHTVGDMINKRQSGDITSLLSALAMPSTPTSNATSLPPATPDRSGQHTQNGHSTAQIPETPPRSVGNAAIPSYSTPSTQTVPHSPRASLLPQGTYRIRITNLKLIWGVNESMPIKASLLFPAPYEAIAGERFVDFMSEVLPLGLVGKGNSFGSVGSFAYSNNTTPSRQSFKRSAGTAGSTNNSYKDSQWKNVGPSRTGTCICLESSRTMQDYVDLPTSPLPSLLLTWRGEEPLDRLHISLKISMLSQSIRSARASITSTPTRNNNEMDSDDIVTGHCALSLEQLCKVAVGSAGGEGSAITTTRMLLNKGRPMYCVDPNTLQREVVSFHCKLELVYK